MTNPDYRAELQLLFDAAESFAEPVLGHHRPWAAALDRARALLAQPVATGPTDEELREMFNKNDWNYISPETFEDIARSVLAQWRHQ